MEGRFIRGTSAIIKGVPRLTGTVVEATDLRQEQRWLWEGLLRKIQL